MLTEEHVLRKIGLSKHYSKVDEGRQGGGINFSRKKKRRSLGESIIQVACVTVDFFRSTSVNSRGNRGFTDKKRGGGRSARSLVERSNAGGGKQPSLSSFHDAD